MNDSLEARTDAQRERVRTQTVITTALEDVSCIDLSTKRRPQAKFFERKSVLVSVRPEKITIPELRGAKDITSYRFRIDVHELNLRMQRLLEKYVKPLEKEVMSNYYVYYYTSSHRNQIYRAVLRLRAQ